MNLLQRFYPFLHLLPLLLLLLLLQSSRTSGEVKPDRSPLKTQFQSSTSTLKRFKRFSSSPFIISELLSRLVAGGVVAIEDGRISPLHVIEQILQQPEFIFEKPSYDKYHKSRLPQQPLPGYPPGIIPAELFLLIINSFT